MKHKAIYLGAGLGLAAVDLANMGLLGHWLGTSNITILDGVKARFSKDAQ